MVQVLVLFRVLLESTGTNFNGSSDGKSGAGWFRWFAAKIWQVFSGTIGRGRARYLHNVGVVKLNA